MAAGKWGESFLKSVLPLEHLTHVTFRSREWDCYPRFEYARANREKLWFEIDLVANSPSFNKGTQLSMLVECKYHDRSRSWFFLPHQAAGRWQFDDRVLNCGPYQTLRTPRADTVLQIAPQSSGAIVVSEDGAKQDNAAYTAIQQVVNGFVPCALSWAFSYNIDSYLEAPSVTALIPVVVTNPSLYRLKPEVTDLDLIRSASGPAEVADQVDWTWCYHDVPSSLREQNLRAVRRHARRFPELVYRFPKVEDTMYAFVDRPNWVAVANIRSRGAVVQSITKAFLAVEMRQVGVLLRPARRAGRRPRRPPTSGSSGRR